MSDWPMITWSPQEIVFFGTFVWFLIAFLLGVFIGRAIRTEDGNE